MKPSSTVRVSCRYCQRAILHAPELTDIELAQLRAHQRQCQPHGAPLAEESLQALLGHFTVRRVGRRTAVRRTTMADLRDDALGVLAAVQRMATNAVMAPVTAGFIALGAGVLLTRSLGNLVEQARQLLPGVSDDHAPTKRHQ